MEASIELVIAEVSHRSRRGKGVDRDLTLAHPSPDRRQGGSGVDTGKVGEGVGAEGQAIGAGDAALLIDPHRSRNVRDGEHFAQQVLAIEQHRDRDALGKGPNHLGVVVEGHRHDAKAVIGKLISQRLPAGEVIAAAAPRGECHQQHLETTQ